MIVGKAIGVAAGLVVNWFPHGVLIGLICGILFDELFLRKQLRRSKHAFWLQEFSTFYLETLSAIARAKGRVTQADIRMIREHAYIAAEDKAIANRILKRAKKGSRSFSFLLSALRDSCDADPELLVVVGKGAVAIGALQGEKGQAMVSDLLSFFNLGGVDWSQIHVEQPQPSPKASHKKQQRSHVEDEPHVTRAYGKKSPYAVLGVKQSVSAADLKKAYRKLVQKHHPDRVRADGGTDKQIQKAEERVAEINAAYEVLQKKKRP